MKSIATTLCFLWLMVSVPLAAQTATAPAAGNGTVGSPYQIATLENLYWITQNSSTWNSYFIQTANIDASATSSWSGGAGMPSIGTGASPFGGSYDGQGYRIEGLRVNKSSDYTGFFGRSWGTLKNIRLFNVSITGDRYVGGLVGLNDGNITGCLVTGSVTTSGSNRWMVGGLVGANYQNIDSCFSLASVSGASWVGGLAGYSVNSIYRIANSFAAGSVSGTSRVGGLVGSVESGNKLINCYATGAVTGSVSVGGLVGYTDGSAVDFSSSFWDTQTTGQAVSTGGGTGKTTAEMKTSSTFTGAGWNLTAPWGMNSAVNNGYPYLRSLMSTPSVSSHTPLMHASNVSASANIVVVFNEPMNASSLAVGTSIMLIGSLSGRHAGSVSYNSGTYTATVDPTTNFLPGEYVTVIVTTSAVNAVNYPLGSPVMWRFTVQTTSSDTLGTLVNAATVSGAIVPVTADLDNDGDVDIATGNYTANTVSVILNTGSRTFGSPTNYSLAASIRSISSADVDNDGDMDLIAAVNNATLAILKNNGNGTFAAAVSYTVGQTPTFIDAADIDGDGDLDLASGNFDANNISVITNNGSGVFSASTNYTGLSGTHGVQFSDVDGDKDMDLIGAGYYSSTMGVYLNNGSGTFGSITTYSTGANPMLARTADLDGDGDEDMITPNAGANSVSVIMNNGNGTFAAKTDYAVGLLPYMAVPADVDGDGDIDIAVTCVNGSALNVLRNNGSGVFSVVPYPLGFTVAGVAAADMDGDGKTDLVLSSHTENLVKVLFAGAPAGKALSFNGTDGYGKVAIPTPTAYTIELWVKPADVTSRIIGSISDGTGPATSYNTHQIGITSDHKFQHYLFDGQLRFITGTTTVVAGQWYHVAITATNNGQMRLFVNGVEEGTAVTIGTMFNSVNTYFFGMSSPQGSAYTGSMDNIRIWNYARSASQLSGAMFTEISGAQSGLLVNYRCSEPTAAVAYDSSGNNSTLNLKGSGYSWNGTGFPSEPSIVSVSPAANSSALTRSGNITATFSIAMDAASFISGSTVKATGSQSGVHNGTVTLSNGGMTMTFDPATDFSAGEKVDVLLTTGIKSTDNIPLGAKKYWSFIVRPAAADTFYPAVSVGATAPGAYALQTADLDGDGDIDIALLSTDDNTLSIIKNNGNGTFAAKVSYAAGTNTISVALADVDGDGDKDMLFTRSSGNVVAVMMNSGDGTFAPKTEYSTGTSPRNVTAGDLDNDGDDDLVVSNNNGSGFSVLKNNGNGTFAAKTEYAFGPSENMVLADVDGDLDLDAILPASGFGVNVAANNGSGVFTSVNYIYFGDYTTKTRWVDAGDIDNDGDIDIVAANFGDYNPSENRTVTVLKNNGNGTFAAGVFYEVGANPSSIQLVDGDGDGDRDIVVTNLLSSSISMLKNNSSGTFGERRDYSTGQYPYSIQSADLDNDGDMDLLTANYGSNDISVFINTTYAVLPVELTSLTAMQRGAGVELQWITATEVNNHGFAVERRALDPQNSGAAEQWSALSFIEGNGTSNTPHEYRYVDRSLSSGRYAYRLKQIDRDGKFEYSQEVEVSVTAPVRFTLDQNYPNPFNPATRITYQLVSAGNTTLKVYDMLGKEVAVLVNGHRTAGEYSVDFNASALPSGIYFYTLRSGTSTQTRKMLLMK
ncbi:MAG: VCBS repeat-containing protein [Bacteroidetes bacterium]|nr:VCBS repeat-containing protein [Bacteroidota bacterium]